MSGWISTKQMNPETKYKHEMKHGIELSSDSVLCCTKKGNTILVLYFARTETDYIGTVTGWYFKNGKPLHENAEVSHWMELPKLPIDKGF